MHVSELVERNKVRMMDWKLCLLLVVSGGGLRGDWAFVWIVVVGWKTIRWGREGEWGWVDLGTRLCHTVWGLLFANNA